MFEVTYYARRINFEVFHALTDGTGALQFLRMLVYQYLTIRYKDSLPDNLPPLLQDASHEQKQEDSFQKYYDPKKKIRHKSVRAYKLKGAKQPEERLSIIEGVIEADAVLRLAREAGVTLTEYLAAALLVSIRREATVRDLERPIILSIPVNLRKYFSSGSARNFFGLISAGYNFRTGGGELENVAMELKKQFAEQLTAENLVQRMSRMTAIEKNLFARAVPLSLKDIVMKIARDSNMAEYTCALSNVGKIDMPDAIGDHIERFDVFNSTGGLQMCLCTYKDKLAVTFTSAFVSTEIQKDFFRELTSRGVNVKIYSSTI